MRAAALIEGLRLEAPIILQPFVVTPVSPDRKFIGRDGRGIFNAGLADAGFVTCVDQQTWAAQLWPRRQLALAVSSPVEGEARTMPMVLALVAGRMTDVLALSHGGDPRVCVSAFERSDDGATWRTAAVMLGEGPFPGSTLDRLAEGRGLAALDPTAVWRTAPSDLRLSLWLSLYRGAAAERAWDARMFRFFALLEAIAGEAFPQPIPAIDADGVPVVNSQGTPMTTATARGATYMLVRRGTQALGLDETVLCAHAKGTLWEEVGVWVDVRNTVAHEGVCRPAPAPTHRPATRERMGAAFELAGRGDLDEGSRRYAAACAAGAEVVLRAVALGRLELS